MTSSIPAENPSNRPATVPSTAAPGTPGAQPSAERVARARRTLIGITLIAAIGGFLYGYDTGIISGTLPQISAEFRIDYHVQEWVTSSILVGAVLGALGAGRLSRAWGRRRTVMTVALVFAVGVVAAGLAVDPAWLIASRLVLGLAVGGSSQIIPMYIAELAPPEHRGRLVVCFNISIGVGIFAAAVVGVAFHQTVSWRWLIAVAALPALVLLVGMIRLPESPRWLVDHDRPREARRVLHRIRFSRRAVDREVEDIVAVSTAGIPISSWRLLREPWVRPALIAGLGVAAFTQLSGLEMMIYYAPTILRDAGFGGSDALWVSLGVASVYLVMTALGRVFVDRLGRRRLMLVMIPGAAGSLFAFAGVFAAAGEARPNLFLVTALLLLFMAFNSGGIQVVGWLLGSELYPLAVREQATSVHAAVLWGSNLVVTATALSMVAMLGIAGAMAVYGVLNAVAFLFVLRRVPETRGRSLERIEGSLRQGTFLAGAGRRG